MVNLKLSHIESEVLVMLLRKELSKIEGSLTESASIARVDLDGILTKLMHSYSESLDETPSKD